MFLFGYIHSFWPLSTQPRRLFFSHSLSPFLSYISIIFWRPFCSLASYYLPRFLSSLLPLLFAHSLLVWGLWENPKSKITFLDTGFNPSPGCPIHFTDILSWQLLWVRRTTATKENTWSHTPRSAGSTTEGWGDKRSHQDWCLLVFGRIKGGKACVSFSCVCACKSTVPALLISWCVH